MTDEEVVSRWWDMKLAQNYDDPALSDDTRQRVRGRYIEMVLNHHHPLVSQFRQQLGAEGLT